MNSHEKTSRDYLEAWRTSQAEMQRLRDALEAERERVRVLRSALRSIVMAYDMPNTVLALANEALAPEGGEGDA